MFTLGIALVISTLAIFFVDIVDMYGILLSVWFYLTPIIYPLEIVPEKFSFLIQLNPMYYMVDLFRQLILDGMVPSAFQWGLTAGLGFIALLLGWWIFTKKSDEFAYRV
jgi:ABC-2 type transport system permease protein